MKKENYFGIVIALLMALAYIVGIPVIWVMERTIFSLCLNTAAVYIVGLVLMRVFCPHFALYRPIRWRDFRKHRIATGFVFAVPLLSLWIGLSPLKGDPSMCRIFVEGILYYVCVGAIEELFCRGILLQAVYKISKNALFSVLIVSVFYGLGHIPGMLGQPGAVIGMRLLWTMSLGIYLGYVYIDSKEHLSLVTLIHILTDLSGTVFVFSERNWYPAKSAAFIFLVYVIVGIYGLDQLGKKEK